MPHYKIISDSSCDLPEEILQNLDISLVNYYFSLDGGLSYQREYLDMTPQQFYKALKNQKTSPKTSLPPIQDYLDAFIPILKDSRDILCICLTSKFSGSYQSAINAREMLKEKFPERRIYVFDSKQCSIAQGNIVIEAANLRDKGYSIQDSLSILENIAEQSRLLITVNSLDYLQRGGRIGLVSSFAGTLLNIKPIINMKDGELHPLSKVRGRNRAIKEIIKIMYKDIGDNISDYKIALLHGDCLEDLKKLNTECASKGFIIDLPDIIIGVTIGVHIGPTVLAIGYFPKLEVFI